MGIKFNPLTGQFDLSGSGGGGATGDVSGPASSTDNAVARFDGTDGKTIQNSSVTIDDSGLIITPVGIATTGAFAWRDYYLQRGPATKLSFNDLGDHAIQISDPGANVGFFSMFGVNVADPATVGVNIKGAAAQTAKVFRIERGGNTDEIFSIDNNGSIRTLGDLMINNIKTNQNSQVDFNTPGTGNDAWTLLTTGGSQFRSNLSINAGHATNRPLILKGFTSQSAPLLEFRDIAEATIGLFDANANYTGLEQGATPSTPATGFQKLYFKTDGNLYKLDDGGIESQVNGGGGGSTFADNAFRIQDNGDATKQLAFEVAAITTGTTRTITVPDTNLSLSTGSGGSFANATLSNLGTTSINGAIFPSSNNAFNIGGSALRWTSLFLNSSLQMGPGNEWMARTSSTTPSGVAGTSSLSMESNDRALSFYTISSNAGGSAASRDVLIETGNRTSGTGNSGNIILTPGTSSGGSRGNIRFVDGTQGTAGHIWTSIDTAGNGAWQAAPSGGANTALSNLITTSINQNLLPQSGNTFDLGGIGLSWNTVYTPRVTHTAGLSVEPQSVNTGSGHLVAIRAGSKTDAGGGNSGALTLTSGDISGNTTGLTGNSVLKSGDTTSTNANSDSGTVTIISGNATTGDSGNVVLQTGTAGAVRGNIRFVDGSEGTSGYVWTSTDTIGSGEWQPAGGGGGANTTLSNLGTTAINTDLIFDFDAIDDLRVVKTRNNAAAATDSLQLQSGDYSGTGAGSGAIILKSGDSSEGTGSVNISSGTPGAGFNGGQVTISSGNTNGVASAQITLVTGNVANAGQSGSFSAFTGNTEDNPSGEVRILTGSSSNDESGPVIIRSGLASGTEVSGSVEIASGENNGTGDSGPVSLLSGEADAGTSGDLNIRSGESVTASGLINIYTGSSTTGQSGNVSLGTGTTLGSGTGSGTVSIATGQAQDGASGAIQMQTGATFTAGGESGGFQFLTGNSEETGGVSIITGDASVSQSGLISLQTGSGNTNSGNVTIGTGSSPVQSGSIALTTATGTSTGSGDITLETGASSGTRGVVILNAPRLRPGTDGDGQIGGETHQFQAVYTQNLAAGAGGSSSDPLTILTITPANAVDSGSITMVTGEATDANSGLVLIQSGEANSTTGGTTGEVTLKTGDFNGDGDTGQLHILTGSPGNISGSSGALDILTGSANSGGTGPITIETGEALGSFNSGALQMNTGASTGATSGDMTISTGNGDTGSGFILLESGNATGAAVISGNVVLRTGIASDTGSSSGSIGISTGDSDGDTGDIDIITGISTSQSRGNISLGAGNVVLNNAHLTTLQSTPPSITDLGQLGTGSSVSMIAGSTDNAGRIRISTGTGAGSGVAMATITFNRPYTSDAFVVLFPANANSGTLSFQGIYINQNTGTDFTVEVNGTLSDGTTYDWNYVVIGN